MLMAMSMLVVFLVLAALYESRAIPLPVMTMICAWRPAPAAVAAALRRSRLELLDAQRQSYASQQTLLDLRRAQFKSAIALYKALGGRLEQSCAQERDGARQTIFRRGVPMPASLLRVFVLVLGLLCPPARAQEPVPAAAPLRVVGFSYPPFMYLDERNAPAGPMVELVAEAMRRMGQPARIELLPLARALQQVESGEASAMFTVKKTPQREAQYVFSSEPLLIQEYVIFVAHDSTLAFRGDLGVLAMSSIGVVGATSYGAIFDAAAQQGVFKKLEMSSSHEANFRKLLAGRMDAIVCSRAVGLEILKQLQATGRVKISGPPIETTQSYLMFNKAAATPQRLAGFDHAIRAMRHEGRAGANRKAR